eukprot:CAMPEP_0184871352 /NCGR_PEP_ID=MMETSP0580-20130426/40669_1 /TAXON_ID=1118495 /ORGANISM="Dactyliosolen fragilissimus" /LENGTH=516 /DNA_ID=CAMNT_0027373999 /DNA_START=225 /DNA_END=1772 /DNA_ORIENTATION=+
MCNYHHYGGNKNISLNAAAAAAATTVVVVVVVPFSSFFLCLPVTGVSSFTTFSVSKSTSTPMTRRRVSSISSSSSSSLYSTLRENNSNNEFKKNKNQMDSETETEGDVSSVNDADADADDNTNLVPSLLSEYPSDHRTGYVSLIGAPNVGKSTLLNALLGTSLCVATSRPQTTRHAILGILNSHEFVHVDDHDSDPDPHSQVLFYDTPGVISDPAYKLQEGMMEAVKGALRDSDVWLIVTDPFCTPIPDDEMFQRIKMISQQDQHRQAGKRIIVAINKIDLVQEREAKRAQRAQKRAQTASDGDGKNYSSPPKDQKKEEEEIISIPLAVHKWRNILPTALAIVPLQASKGSQDPGVQALRTLLLGGPDVPSSFRNLGRPIQGMFSPGVQFIQNEEAKSLLPPCPPLYSGDELTDRNERFFTCEIIRATLFNNLGKELPYCCDVRIESFREPRPSDKQEIVRISAAIFVERDSQKGIVVGKGGAKIRSVGIDARKELEDFLQMKVHLELNVKVDKNW